jgi:hypothetical protein
VLPLRVDHIFPGVGPHLLIVSVLSKMRDLDEINRLLTEVGEELADLDARRSKLLARMAELQQEKSSFLPGQQARLLPDLPPVTNISSSWRAAWARSSGSKWRSRLPVCRMTSHALS